MRTARNMWLIAGLAFCLALGVSTSAFAAPQAGGYVPWSEVATLTGQGTSPHGGYKTTTVKCAVCHAVHAATGLASEALLQDPASDACTYCHVGGAGGYSQVYGGVPSNYSGSDLPNAHNTYVVNGVPQGPTCAKCHQVHGADAQMTTNPYLTTKILRGDKTYNDFTPNYDVVAQAPLSTDDSATALTKWCTQCHPGAGGLGSGTYYGDGYNGQSHIMTTATATYANPAVSYDGRVAWKNSTYCSSCHSSGFGTSAWPHFTAGEGFLESAASANTSASGTLRRNEDGVCLRCHRSATSGVGLSF